MDGKNWKRQEGKLYKKFNFNNFLEALNFVNKIGNLSEKENHHPDIRFGWGYVEVLLFTHSEHAVTDKDKMLAAQIDKVT